MKKVTVIIMAAVAIFISACGEKKKEEKKQAVAAIQYQLAKVQKGSVAQSIKLPAQLAAYEEVSIFPKMNGYVKQVLVDIGSHVTKGQLLMTLEAPELIQAALQGKEKYARTKADYTLSRERYQRLMQAAQTAGAVSPLDISAARSRMEADSIVSNAERASWQMQETMLAYLRVTAPFTGVITERNVHPGALVSATSKDNKPMLELKQVARLRLKADVPEHIAAGLKNGDSIIFFVSAFPGKKNTARISRKANAVSMQFRSEKLEIDVDNSKAILSPGMYAEVLLNVKGNINAFRVPRSAVVTSTERKYVLVVKQGKTVKVDVTTGNESMDSIEVFGNLAIDDEVITGANDEIKEGVKI